MGYLTGTAEQKAAGVEADEQLRPCAFCCGLRYVSHSLNSLQGVLQGIIQGTAMMVVKGDTRTLDCSSCGGWRHVGV